MLNLVTYNLFKGGPSDYSAFGRVLDELNPDILLLQEVSDPKLYLAHVPADLQEQAACAIWGKAGTNYWGSAIYARHGTLTPLPLPSDLGGWITAAEVDDLPWRPAKEPLRVFNIHTPTRENRNYIGEVHRIIDVITSMAEGYDVIIGGDFNMTVSARHEAEPRKNTVQEGEIHRRLRRELGLINCWQALHPNQALPQTYRHQFQADSAPYHLDGLFIPASWYRYLDTCDVLNVEPWVGRSDHFPVTANFTLQVGQSQDSYAAAPTSPRRS